MTARDVSPKPRAGRVCTAREPAPRWHSPTLTVTVCSTSTSSTTAMTPCVTCPTSGSAWPSLTACYTSAPELAGRFSFDNRGGVLENGDADVLFRNAGNGRFVPVDWTNGAFLGENGEPVRTPYDWGLSAMFRDLNGDGAPDLYVCNDFQSPDRIWINDGHGRFRAIARQAIRQTSLFSMGVDFADIDRDGLDDFFVADML
ncbi:MAG: VCBS repeat-containing protein, partial [Verrucomicrobia bacterium]